MAKSKNKRKKSKSKKKSKIETNLSSSPQDIGQKSTSPKAKSTQITKGKKANVEIANQASDIDPIDLSPNPRNTPPSSRHSRALIFLLIVFFSAQMWAAGSYYWGDYPWDERFSWRMFSTVRSLSCQVQMWESTEQGALCPDGQTSHCTQVRLSSRYHMVWVNLLKRGRRQVLKKIAQQECSQRQPNEAIFINLSCPSPEPPHQQITIQNPKVNLCETL